MHARRTSRLVAAAVAAGLSLLAVPLQPAAAQTAPPGGAFADAQGVVVDLTVLTAVSVPGALSGRQIDPNTFSRATQTCPPQEDQPASDRVAEVPAAPAATASVVTTSARAVCSTPSSVAVAQTESVAALFSGGVPLITADALRAQANSDCTTAPNAAGTVFTNLVVAGRAISRTPAPNTRIEIPGLATVILNEQNPAAGGRGIVVNAVHVIGASPLLRGDLIISHAVSGVVCPDGKGSEVAEGLQAPDIVFDKDASPTTARPGDRVTYTATVTNTSDQPCDVLSFVDHLNPVFTFVSTRGDFGTEAETVERSDGGQDVVLRPTELVLAPDQRARQTFVVTLEEGTRPGTYYNDLELFCAVNGDFASGPLAPVTVPAERPAATPAPTRPAGPPVTGGDPIREELPRTGPSALVGTGALLLLLGALGVRRLTRA